MTKFDFMCSPCIEPSPCIEQPSLMTVDAFIRATSNTVLGMQSSSDKRSMTSSSIDSLFKTKGSCGAFSLCSLFSVREQSLSHRGRETPWRKILSLLHPFESHLPRCDKEVEHAYCTVKEKLTGNILDCQRVQAWKSWWNTPPHCL